MVMTSIAAFFCYLLAALLSMIFGAMYLTRSRFMPYHEDALGIAWKDLDARLQALLLAFMRISGGGFVAAALSLLLMLLVPFRQGEAWAKYAIPAVGLVAASSVLSGTLLVRRRTPASPPVGLGLVGIVLIVVGFALSML